MEKIMKIAAAQLNPTVGDIDGNLKKLIDTVQRAAGDGADLIVFPELFLTGYPPKDLLERKDFIIRAEKAVERVQKISRTQPRMGILFGAPMREKNNTGMRTFNAAVLVSEGKTIGLQHKTLLPTYDVFDETRYFDHANEIGVVPFGGEQVGISICEDAWNDPVLWPSNRMYSG